MVDELKYIEENEYHVQFYSEKLGYVLFDRETKTWFLGKMEYRKTFTIMPMDNTKKVEELYKNYIRSKKLERIMK